MHSVRDLAASQQADVLSDPELLERFADRGDEAAFAALVRRHGPMVRGICRRVLRHTQDAEDACQAAFLALARKADSVRHREALGGWLYRVTHRIALRVRGAATRQSACGGLALVKCQADASEEVTEGESESC